MNSWTCYPLKIVQLYIHVLHVPVFEVWVTIVSGVCSYKYLVQGTTTPPFCRWRNRKERAVPKATHNSDWVRKSNQLPNPHLTFLHAAASQVNH